ncbi:LOW QUALITY PROTEIN: thioredoxin-dependent peroxide reductase, mitochondrial-like [Urocitellus parryii]
MAKACYSSYSSLITQTTQRTIHRQVIINSAAGNRPVASIHLTNIQYSGSSHTKLTFSTSSSYHAPAATQHTPFFKGTAVAKGEFKELSLDDFNSQNILIMKYLVLFFYPVEFTFLCPTEVFAFSVKANEFHNVNCEVVAVSVYSHQSHLALMDMQRKLYCLCHMNIALFSDLTQISDYSVLFESAGLALRGLFIIDSHGVIKHLSNKDLPVGQSMEENLCLVKAFQFVETHGEVCPANWTQDSPIINTTPTASKEYFEKISPQIIPCAPAASHVRKELQLETFKHLKIIIYKRQV